MKPLLILLLVFASGCIPAKSQDSPRVDILTAPDGARCYAIMQGDEVKAGSCVQ